MVLDDFLAIQRRINEAQRETTYLCKVVRKLFGALTEKSNIYFEAAEIDDYSASGVQKSKVGTVVWVCVDSFVVMVEAGNT